MNIAGEGSQSDQASATPVSVRSAPQDLDSAIPAEEPDIIFLLGIGSAVAFGAVIVVIAVKKRAVSGR